MDGNGGNEQEHCKQKKDFVVEGSWGPEIVSH